MSLRYCLSVPIILALTLVLPGAVPAYAQFTVEGTVTDAATGEPLPGVNIFDAASSRGTVTDIEGYYALELPGEAATLHFSFVGYVPEEVAVTAGIETVDVALQRDVAELSELVVTGLASSIERSNLANAVATVDAEELTGTVASQTLAGRSPARSPAWRSPRTAARRAAASACRCAG